MSRANRRRPKGYNGAAEKPPLSAATGPLAAKDLLERYAIEEPRHLILEGLAADLGVRVVDAELAGAVARLARVGDRGRIRVSRRVTNALRRRFSIAHESRPLRVESRGAMNFGKFQFGGIEIDGATYKHDVVIDRGRIRKRKKKPSKKFREEFGHTPVSVEEEIPWKCRRLVVGTGRYGSLPLMDEVKIEARSRKVDLLILPTDDAIETLANKPKGTNAILHVTC